MIVHARRFSFLVGVQVTVILLLILVKQTTLWTGVPLLLKTVPVDPMDLFRGEYVALHYEISEISQWRMGALHPKQGETVYVALKRAGRFWDVDRVTDRPPADAAAFLRGQVTRVRHEGKDDPATYSLAYGIESWFVPKGEGIALEREGARRDRQLVVTAIVDRHGKAVLRQVNVEPRANR